MGIRKTRVAAWSAVGLTAVMVLSSCGWVDSAAESLGGSDETKEQDMRVDLGPGETHSEQIEEIEEFVRVMQDHLSDDYVWRGGESDTWSAEHQAENHRPIANCSGDESFRQMAIFDYEGLDAEQALAAGYEMAQDLGFSTSEEITADGTGQRPMRFVASGEGGRSLIIRQQADDENIIEVFYRTRCSEHESLQEAFDRIVGEIQDQQREERQREREELREEIRDE
ncbi:hypothetical protein FEF26_14870 [Nesterenkonia salmonea]|uniref:Uncharacterized protein n=1 Tax=Nesterenkonia salmonea TaxID=1804987 RepID=A0A5R9B702_9MICC|nr:hypothetical protein [Nesterenkonia salmonea]TLP92349.1 hypothetical protein FEF26_14870 [Nesterenkonia salmonea]